MNSTAPRRAPTPSMIALVLALGVLAGDPGARGVAADMGGASLELTRIGVDMKVLIEQMREQVQNLE